MSGYEPGRPKIEEREAHLIWNGTRVLLDGGVEWTVTDWVDVESVPMADEHDLIFYLEREVNGETQRVRRPVQQYSLIRCRVEDEDR